MRTPRPAFTLLELMLVLGIMGILVAIVLVAINPTKQLRDARGGSRDVSIREIQNALSQYIIDGHAVTGAPASMATAKDICQTAVTGTSCTNAPVSGFDLSALSPTYLVSIPVDPSETGSLITGYRIYRNGSFFQVCSKFEGTGCGG